MTPVNYKQNITWDHKAYYPGAHFNPAVTIAFALTRHFAWRDVPFYIRSQRIGATVGAFTLHWLFGDIAHLGVTLPNSNVMQSLGLEILLTPCRLTDKLDMSQVMCQYVERASVEQKSS